MASSLNEYAKALYDLTARDERKDMVLFLEDSIKILLDDDETRNFFLYPFIKKSEKKNVLEKTMEKSVGRDFLFVLIDNERLSDFQLIKEEFEKLVLSDENFKNVKVYSKTLLDKKYLDKLKIKLEKKIGAAVTIENVIDENIIAGLRIAYDSKEIDLTLNEKLDDFVSKLKE